MTIMRQALRNTATGKLVSQDPDSGFRSFCPATDFIGFDGHFPDYPIFPGVLIVEAMAQVGAIAVLSVPENKGKIVLFAGIDRLRFRGPVYPGDTLRLEVKFTKMRGSIGKGTAKATVEGKTVAEGELTFAIANSI